MASVWKPKRCLRPIRSKPLVRREVLLKEELVSYVCFLSRSHQTGIQGAHAPGKNSTQPIELMGQELLYELMMPMNKPVSPSFHAAKAAGLIFSPLWAPIVTIYHLNPVQSVLMESIEAAVLPTHTDEYHIPRPHPFTAISWLQ